MSDATTFFIVLLVCAQWHIRLVFADYGEIMLDKIQDKYQTDWHTIANRLGLTPHLRIMSCNPSRKLHFEVEAIKLPTTVDRTMEKILLAKSASR
jgi:hypothetical protein